MFAGVLLVVTRGDPAHAPFHDEFLDLDIFETQRELAKEEFKAWKTRVKETDLEALDDEIHNSRSDLNAVRREIIALDADTVFLDSKISDCDKTMLALAEALPKKGETVSEVDPKQLFILKAQIDAMEKTILAGVTRIGDSSLTYVNPNDVKKIVADVDALAKEQTAKERAIEKFRTQKDQDMRKASLLQSVPCGDQFPTCKFLVDAVDAKERIVKFDATKLTELELDFAETHHRYEQAKQSRDDFQKMLTLWNEFEAMKLKVEEYKLNLEKMREKEKKLVEQIAECERVATQRLKKKQIEQQMKTLGEEKSQHQNALVEVRKLLTDFHKRAGSYETTLERAEKLVREAKEAKEWCTAYEYYDEAMGKNGIPLTILSRKLPRINEEIAKVLSAGVDFGVVVEYDAVSQTMPLFLVPKDGEKLRPLELASGAQKFLASLAMRVALLRISSLPRCTTFVVDEGFGKLDPSNIEGVSRIFDVLRTSFKHVLIVSHLDVLKDIVDDSIDITTDDKGRAHVEVM